MEDWQPIETAPKDGTRVLVLIPYNLDYERCVDVGHWQDGHECFRFIGDDGPHDIQPTRWMPLPDPPD